MSAQLLSEPTQSGEYEEHRFNAKGDCSWVLFQPPSAADWVGVFGKAKWGRSALAVNWAAERAFVIAGGQGYLIDTTTRALPYQTSRDRLQDVVYVEARLQFAVADESYLHVFDHDRPLWSSARISWDGIRGLSARGSVVTGEAWTPSAAGDAWSPFALDLESKTVTGATYNGPDAAYGTRAT